MATIEGEIVGATVFCTYERSSWSVVEKRFPPAELIYEFDLAVLPKFQGGTIGYLLAKQSIEEARSAGCAEVRNWVINPKASRLLEFFGFKHEYPESEHAERGGTEMFLRL